MQDWLIRWKDEERKQILSNKRKKRGQGKKEGKETFSEEEVVR